MRGACCQDIGTDYPSELPSQNPRGWTVVRRKSNGDNGNDDNGNNDSGNNNTKKGAQARNIGTVKCRRSQLRPSHAEDSCDEQKGRRNTVQFANFEDGTRRSAEPVDGQKGRRSAVKIASEHLISAQLATSER